MKSSKHFWLVVLLMGIIIFVNAQEYAVVTGHPIHDDCTLLVIRIYDNAGTPKDRSDDVLIAKSYELVGACKAFKEEKEASSFSKILPLKLFPNPNNGKFQVDLGNTPCRSIFVIDMQSHQKIDLESSDLTGVQSFDLSYLPEGHYVFFVVGKSTIRSAKVQIAK